VTWDPRWGYVRIVGEFSKLGVRVSMSSVRNILRRHRLGPAPRRDGPTWVEFLRSQATSTLASDFFSVKTMSLQRLYVLFFIELERRQLLLAAVTAHPDGPWTTQQQRNLAMTLDGHRSAAPWGNDYHLPSQDRRRHEASHTATTTNGSHHTAILKVAPTGPFSSR
jgi:putative transposase